MIAFGMADGCVAVRNLQTKETLSRYMNILVSDSSPTESSSASMPDSMGFSSLIKGESLGTNGEITASKYVKKVEFLFSGGAPSRLLSLCNSGIAVWEPKQVM